jgi:hypothetical protein
LATPYVGFSLLFVNILKIQKPTLLMHIKALGAKCEKLPPNKTEVLEEMKTICGYELTPETVKELSDCVRFPIRSPDGVIVWMNVTCDFAIVDRHNYGKLFIDKVATLDLSLEQAHRISTLLHGLGLEKRLLSRLVEENTTVQNGVRANLLTAAWRSKAYAICRCLAHLDNTLSDDYWKTVLTKLQNTEIYTSESICRSLLVQIGSNQATAQSEIAYVHITTVDSKTHIYVPLDESRQETCYSSHLPRKLCEYFGLDYDQGTLRSILSARSLDAIDGMLQEAGIIEIPGIEREDLNNVSNNSNFKLNSYTLISERTTSNTRSSSHSPPSPTVSNAQLTHSVVFTPPETPPQFESRGVRSSHRNYFRSNDFNDQVYLSGPAVSSGAIYHIDQPALYKELLEKVSKVGRWCTFQIPDKEESRLCLETQTTFASFDVTAAVTSSHRHTNVGAAGELFVSKSNRLNYEYGLMAIRCLNS